MASHRDGAGLQRMPELPVASALPHAQPPVLRNNLNVWVCQPAVPCRTQPGALDFSSGRTPCGMASLWCWNHCNAGARAPWHILRTVLVCWLPFDRGARSPRSGDSPRHRSPARHERAPWNARGESNGEPRRNRTFNPQIRRRSRTAGERRVVAVLLGFSRGVGRACRVASGVFVVRVSRMPQVTPRPEVPAGRCGATRSRGTPRETGNPPPGTRQQGRAAPRKRQSLFRSAASAGENQETRGIRAIL
jgi:hypothetical protein